MIKSNIYVTISVILSHLICNSNEQSVPSSPCPNIFQYAYEGNQWVGMIQLSNVQYSSELKVDVVLSLRAQLPTASLCFIYFCNYVGLYF